jgi:Sigma-70, region 4
VATAEVPVIEESKDTVITGGVPIAVLAIRPDELSLRSGLHWHDDQDELDALRFTVIRVADGDVPFVVLAYEHDPIGSVTVIGEPEHVADGELDKLLVALRVDRDEVVDRLDQAPIESAESLELVRDVAHARLEIEQRLEAIAALSSRIEQSLAKVLAESANLHENLPDWLPQLLEKEGFTTLTDRQQEVILLLLRGATVEDVAEQLHVSRDAVVRTMSRARSKLAQAGRAERSSRSRTRRTG